MSYITKIRCCTNLSCGSLDVGALNLASTTVVRKNARPPALICKHVFQPKTQKSRNQDMPSRDRIHGAMLTLVEEQGERLTIVRRPAAQPQRRHTKNRTGALGYFQPPNDFNSSPVGRVHLSCLNYKLSHCILRILSTALYSYCSTFRSFVYRYARACAAVVDW